MFETLMKMAQPNKETTVLDVGATMEEREDANFFEKLYPYPHNITAVSTEDVRFLEKEFPGLKSVEADGAQLPFPDKSFDLVISTATLEHAGSRDRQRRFVNELCRVGRIVCITIPNRGYPIEFHTFLPFVHWLPHSWFRFICKSLGKVFFAKEENLNLLSEKDVLAMFSASSRVSVKRFRILGLVSNLMFYTKT